MADEPETDSFLEGDSFLKGQSAAKQGRPATDNPYPESSPSHARWREGHASPGPPEDISEELGKFA